jgi:trans-2,3-dihydro-3-hydroxyanthranilate isomerase
VILEEGAGPVAVEVRLEGTAPFARLTREGEIERPAARPSRPAAATALSPPEREVLDAWFASVGVSFCFLHLASAEAVDRATLERAVWATNFSGAWAPNLYLFAGEPAPGSRLHVRMFAPALGIEEDPATGSGAAALAGCLAERLASDGTFAWQIDQGVAMGRPSRLEAWAERRGGRTVSVKVGGSTVLVGEGAMTVPAGL